MTERNKGGEEWEWEREWDSCWLTSHMSTTVTSGLGQSWAWNFTYISRVGDRNQLLKPSSVAFPGTLEGRVNQYQLDRNLNQYPIQWFVSLSHIAGPIILHMGWNSLIMEQETNILVYALKFKTKRVKELNRMMSSYLVNYTISYSSHH